MKTYEDYVDLIFKKLKDQYPGLSRDMVKKVLKYASSVIRYHMWRGTAHIFLKRWGIMFNPNARNWFKRKNIKWKKEFDKDYKY